jgi:exonuclease VII small subunit
MTQNNLSNAFLAIGGLETGIVSLQKAVAAYDEALNIYTREHTPLLWAMTQYNLADACCVWGDRENGTARLERAVAAYDQARKVYYEHLPQRLAMITGKQGVALMLLAERLGDLNTARIAVHQISLAFAAMREANDMAAYFAQGRPAFHGMSVHGFTPGRSSAREAGRSRLSLSDVCGSSSRRLSTGPRAASLKPVRAGRWVTGWDEAERSALGFSDLVTT